MPEKHVGSVGEKGELGIQPREPPAFDLMLTSSHTPTLSPFGGCVRQISAKVVGDLGVW